MRKDEFPLIDTYTKSKVNDVLDKIYVDIQRLRGCSCYCTDGIIDDVEDILDEYKIKSEDNE